MNHKNFEVRDMIIEYNILCITNVIILIAHDNYINEGDIKLILNSNSFKYF